MVITIFRIHYSCIHNIIKLYIEHFIRKLKLIDYITKFQYVFFYLFLFKLLLFYSIYLNYK